MSNKEDSSLNKKPTLNSMKPPKTVKETVKVPSMESTLNSLNNQNKSTSKKDVFTFRFLKRKTVVDHSVATLMNAFMHLIRETELNIKIYRTLNHERALPGRKYAHFNENQTNFN
jgi:hypothetical protein